MDKEGDIETNIWKIPMEMPGKPELLIGAERERSEAIKKFWSAWDGAVELKKPILLRELNFNGCIRPEADYTFYQLLNSYFMDFYYYMTKKRIMMGGYANRGSGAKYAVKSNPRNHPNPDYQIE